MCSTVIYTLSEADASRANARRIDLKSGESFPAVKVREFKSGAANLQVHLGEALGDLIVGDPLENSEPCSDFLWSQGVMPRAGRVPGTWEPLPA